ncbi:MAG: hypothetical protein ACOC93_05930 [Planctomycetota bacterium]
MLNLSLRRSDNIAVRRWLGLYALVMLLAAVCLWALLPQDGWSISDPMEKLAGTVFSLGPAVKLLGLGIYLALCGTFLPMPTGWVIAAVATRETAVFPDIWVTVLAVGAVGAIASTVANLNDYHLITLVLRSKRVGKLRHTRTYKAAEKWFHRSPMFILTLFNLLPVPVDAVRILAASARYPRLPFVVSNFIGRFLRYGLIAWITFQFNLGWYAVAGLLAFALSLALGKLGWSVAQKVLAR